MSYTIFQMANGRYGYALYDAGSLAPFIVGGNYKLASSARRAANDMLRSGVHLIMRVIGYTYNADCHCVNCARDSLKYGQFGHVINCPDGTGDDENGIPYDAMDREGNAIHPIFSTDEGFVDDEGIEHPHTCGDCGTTIES